MFQCPISGQLCLNHKNYSIYKVINGQPAKLPVCENCANHAMSVEYQTFAWQNFLHQIFRVMHIDKVLTRDEYEYAIVNIKNKDELNTFIEMLAQRKKKVDELPNCPQCGLDITSLFSKGQPGCAKCYSHFYEYLKALIQKVQDQAIEHVGKIPVTNNVEKLQQEMQLAIEEERYEDAAKLRDQIKQLKS